MKTQYAERVLDSGLLFASSGAGSRFTCRRCRRGLASEACRVIFTVDYGFDYCAYGVVLQRVAGIHRYAGVRYLHGCRQYLRLVGQSSGKVDPIHQR